MSDIADVISQAESADEYRYMVTRIPEMFARIYFGLELSDYQIQMLNHARDNRRSLILVPKGHGKLLALRTKIPTPEGWTTIEEIKIGDELFAVNGDICRVVAKSEVETPRCYKVSDVVEGTHVIAGEDHLWPAILQHKKDGSGRRPRCYTTKEIAKFCSDSGTNPILPMNGPLGVPWRALPEDSDAVSAALSGKAAIPREYLRANEAQRINLLRRILDRRGSVTEDGHIKVSLSEVEAAHSVAEMVRSLGFRAVESVGSSHIVSLDPNPRSAANNSREITVEETDPEPCQCIQVSSRDGCFLCGDFFATHNSTLISKVLPILEVCTNPNVRIILIMKNFDEAKAYADAIRTELRENKKLIEDFGPFYTPDNWKAQSFNVIGRQHNDPHQTLEIYGEKGRYLGHRSDITICDDIVTEENSKTREAREALKSKFEVAIQTGPQPMWTYANSNCKWHESSRNLKVPWNVNWPKDINYERLIVCGTRFHPHDLYHKLEQDKTFKKLYFDCWKDKEETQPIWPGMWTREKLNAEKKSLGTLSFNKRYRNIAVDESELAFKREWITGGELYGEEFPGCLNVGRSWGDHGDWQMWTGFDPASGSTSRWATFPSFVCVGVERGEVEEGVEKRRYLVDIFRQQTGFDDLLDVLLDGNPRRGIPGFRKLYNYETAVIESNAYGTFFISNEKIRRAENTGLHVVPHWTGRNKTDAIDGVYTMQGIFKQGLVDIPYRTEEDQRKSEELIEQILTFPKGIVDYLMAFWFVELQIRKTVARRRSVTVSRQSRWGMIQNPHYLR